MIAVVVDEIRSFCQNYHEEFGGALGCSVRAALVHNRLVPLALIRCEIGSEKNKCSTEKADNAIFFFSLSDNLFVLQLPEMKALKERKSATYSDSLALH
jgi:hypothetical protein